MTDTLYFSADEVMKGIRLLYNEMDFEMFKRELFPSAFHTDEYILSWFAKFGKSPFQFWCSIDETKRERLNFLIDDCANRELAQEKKASKISGICCVCGVKYADLPKELQPNPEENWSLGCWECYMKGEEQ